jgi:hypothetical protein
MPYKMDLREKLKRVDRQVGILKRQIVLRINLKAGLSNQKLAEVAKMPIN